MLFIDGIRFLSTIVVFLNFILIFQIVNLLGLLLKTIQVRRGAFIARSSNYL